MASALLVSGCGGTHLMNSAKPVLAALVLSLLGGTAACAVEEYPPAVGGYATVYAYDVPPNIYAYPHAYFEGGYAYLANDRWYYPSRGGWVMLRREPPQLYRYRTTYVQPAPPAYRGYEREPYRAPVPPAPYAYPPPATRVR
jgi:hypothetical protein